MLLPKEIHFCGKTYQVEEVDELDGNDSWGRTMVNSQKIFIEKRMADESKQETLLHELMHIAYRHTFSDLEREKEEKMVKAFSRNIYGILKDNGLLKD